MTSSLVSSGSGFAMCGDSGPSKRAFKCCLATAAVEHTDPFDCVDSFFLGPDDPDTPSSIISGLGGPRRNATTDGVNSSSERIASLGCTDNLQPPARAAELAPEA